MTTFLETDMNMITELLLKRPHELTVPGSRAHVHSEEQIEKIKQSIEAFGFVLPVLIDSSGMISAGTAVFKAACELGFEQIPCVCAEWFSEAQTRAFALAHNKLAELASWDKAGVAEELLYLEDAGFDIQLTGFEESDMLYMDPEEVREDDYVPELPAEPRSKRGQIWQLGQHRLMCGDSTHAWEVEKLMDGKQAQLLITDPPYNVDITGGTDEHLKIDNDNMSENDFLDFLELAFEAALGVMEKGASFYIWHADGGPGWMFRTACHETGFKVRQNLIWVKNSPTIGRQDYHWQHESCLHGQTDPADFLECGDTWNDHDSCLYGWKDGAAHRWCSDRKQTTILEFDRPTRSEEHPTMKPVKLFAYQIANSTLPGAIAVDLFAGSGTTVIACEQLNRAAYVMEYDPRFCDVIIDRWEKFTGQKAVLLDAT